MDRTIPSSGGALRLIAALILACLAVGSAARAAQFTLTWSDNSSNEAGFRIERSSNGSSFSEIATVGANVTSYVDSGLPASTQYWYRVRAYNSAGNSAYSNVANGTTPAVASNTAPTITSIANQSITSGGTTGALAFTVGDAETAAGSLAVTRASSNTTLVPLSGAVLGGSGANRSITITPAAGQTGSATITVTVSDGTLSANTSFTVNVTAPNTAPTISTLADQTIAVSTNTGALAFSIGDAQTAASSLTVTASSSNTTVIRNSGLSLGGGGANRTITVTPRTGFTGSSTITVTVSDGSLSASTSFSVTVTAANTAPTITAIPDQSITPGSSTGALPFTIADGQTAAGSLTVHASSSNTTLAPVSGIGFGGSGGNRTVTVTPASGQTGTATITVIVSDGSLSASTAFVVTVGIASSGPTITAQPQSTPIALGSDHTLSVTVQATGTISYQWYYNGVAIVGATSSSYTIPMAQRQNAGAYHVVVSAGGTSVTSSTVNVAAAPFTSTGRLANLSARALVQTGNNVLINGFVISGSAPKRVLLRAVGPTLTEFGLTGVLPDPQLVLKRQTQGGYTDVATNLDWASGGNAAALRQEFSRLAAFDLADNSGDAVLLLDLEPGVYSVFAADEQAGRTGLSIVEFYDADSTATGSRMSNISNRGFIGSGNNVMVTGFVVVDGPQTVLVRTVGPGLTQFGLTGTLANPRMGLYRRVNGEDVLIFQNDDWGADSDAAYTQAVTEQVSAFALSPGGLDAAFVRTLPVGVYTVVSQGAGTTTGLAIVELYAVP